MTTPLAIFFVGVLIFLAHLFVALFSRTKIPDAILLIGIGALLGPAFHLVRPEHFGKVGPIFSQIALAIILFEGGVEMRLKLIKENWKAGLLLILPTFFTITLVIGYLIQLSTGLGFHRSMLLGAIMGSTSPSVIISMIRYLKMQSGPRLVLMLETAITDILCIVLVLGFIEAHRSGGMRLDAMAGSVVMAFGLAALIGLASGAAWSLLLNRLRAIHNNIFLTLALVFVLFGAMEAFHLSGGVAVLCFGAGISNSGSFRLERLVGGRLGLPVDFTSREKAFFSEVVFLLRTFFFVFLGLSLHFGESRLFLLAIGLVTLAFIIRIPFVRLAMPRSTNKRDASLMTVMGSKGLAAAVLASLPYQQGLDGGEIIRDLAYAFIPISIMLNSVLVFLLDKTRFGKIHGLLFNGFAEPIGSMTEGNGSLPGGF